MNREKSI